MTKAIYFCVLAVLACVLLGQAMFISLPLTGLWGVVWLLLCWRYRQANFSVWPKLLLVLFTLLCLGLIFLSYRTFLGVEAGVAFLSTCLFSKIL